MCCVSHVSLHRLSPLHYAVENNALNCIDCFAQHPNVANMSDANGRNPIMWAAVKGQDKSLQVNHLCIT